MSPVNIDMDPMTVPPGVELITATAPTLVMTKYTTVAEVVTHTVKHDDGTFTAIIGGVVVAVLLIMICVAVMLTWLVYRHKGSYVTNEADDEESLASDAALQSKEPLRKGEDE